MKKGCLIACAIALVSFLAIGAFIWSKRDSIIEGVKGAFEVPEYGEKEFILGQHGDFLKQLDAAATNATSVFKLGAAIEGLTLPESLVFIGIEMDDETTPVIKKFDWDGHNHLIMSGFGAGTLTGDSGTKKIMIYENSGPWTYMDSFVVYFEYKEPQEEKKQ
jgi:hypothetical protein